jgi:hypothetical protein
MLTNANAAIAKSIVDAKGDIIAATAADTVSRLAVGANDTVLTADSSTGTGLKWATPVSGSMTLLSTTAITATNSITVSSISSAYTNLVVFCENFALNTTGNVQMRFNSDSGSNYSQAAVQSQTGTVVGSGTSTNFATVGNGNLAATNNASFVVTIPFYSNTAAYKFANFSITGIYGGTSNPVILSGGVAYKSTSAISSITLMSSGETLLAQGNIKIYGVK